jgi:hypothetical protein
VLRLAGTERAVAEVAAIAEHVASLTTAACAFQLRPDVPVESGDGPERPLVPLLDEEQSAPEARATLRDIRAWSQATLRIDRVPAIWRALARQPSLLEATWRKDRLIMTPGALDALVKACAALAVAQFRQSGYWIRYYTHLLRHTCGLDDRAIVEVSGAVMHYVSFNTIAHAMRLEAPVREMSAAAAAPGGALESIIPPGARRRGSAPDPDSSSEPANA